MKKKTIAIIAFTHLHQDPRILKQIAFLKDDFNLVTMGLSDPGNSRFVPLLKKRRHLFQKALAASCLLTHQFERYYWSRPEVVDSLKKFHNIKSDLIIANDVETLPLSLHLAKQSKSKLLFDAHEYSPLQFEDVFQWRLFYQKYMLYLCKRYLPYVDHMLSVSSGIAKKYKEEFSVNCDVITNAKTYVEKSPSPCDEHQIRMICHGAAIPSRKYENLIEVMKHVDKRFSLDFFLVPSSVNYLNKLQAISKKNPKIRFNKPIPFEQIVDVSNQYDIGIYHLMPTSFNKLHCLPNKFYEFIQARLALAFPPLVEIAPLIKKYRCGIIAKDFQPLSLATKLNALSKDKIYSLKVNAEIAAKELSAENNRKVMRDIVSRLLD